jgi:hypothetical protein
LTQFRRKDGPLAEGNSEQAAQVREETPKEGSVAVLINPSTLERGKSDRSGAYLWTAKSPAFGEASL